MGKRFLWGQWGQGQGRRYRCCFFYCHHITCLQYMFYIMFCMFKMSLCLPKQWLTVVCLHNVPCIYLSQRLQMEISLWLFHFLSCIRDQRLSCTVPD